MRASWRRYGQVAETMEQHIVAERDGVFRTNMLCYNPFDEFSRQPMSVMLGTLKS